MITFYHSQNLLNSSINSGYRSKESLFSCCSGWHNHIPSHFDPRISSNTSVMASRMASRTLFKRFNIGERYASQVATVAATSSAAKAQVKTKNFDFGFGFNSNNH